ncbi:MAG: RdgB/HAM1 family non-canonical purine NTP pyrophosphatase [Verrucomicrobiota bacterium]
MPTLVVATKNAHKTEEIAAILHDLVDTVTDLTTHPEIPAPVEDGDTFEANAAIKALAASAVLPTDTLVLADDSGVEVDALDRAPGIYSARYAGENASDEDNRQKLLTELAATGARGKERTGRFRCVMILARNGETLATADGTVEGIITNEAKGEGGFGYDPLFIPDGHCETFAQLNPDTKNQLSHRARALQQIRTALQELLSP